MKQVRWSDHARFKLELLSAHGLVVEPLLAEDIVRNPEKVDQGYKGRRIAQGNLGSDRVLRVVYEEAEDFLTIITLYPGKRRRYEKTSL